MNTPEIEKHSTTSFEINFFKRTVLITIGVSLLVFCYALFFNWRWAVIYLVTSLLVTGNFYLLYLIMERLLLRRARYSTLILVFVKFGVIFGIAILFFLQFGFNFSAFLGGLNTLFLVIILRCVGVHLFSRISIKSDLKSHD